MAHFAHINNGIVDSVLVIDEETLVSKGGWYVDGVLKPLNEWVQTSYNTGRGEYKLGKTKAEKNSNKRKGNEKDIKARNRKNFAGVGYTYDPIDDAFFPPQRFPSWKLNKATGQWEAPKKEPVIDLNTETFVWDESITDWVIIPIN